MKKLVTIKVIGERQDVFRILKIIQENCLIIRSSRLIPNGEGFDTCHCFVDLELVEDGL